MSKLRANNLSPLDDSVTIDVANLLDSSRTSLMNISANLGYKSSFSKSTLRTVADKLDDSVSAKDFGAKGDGVTDDSAAIQAALDTGKSVFLPAGSYVISTALTIPSGGALYGESLTSTTIMPALTVNAVTFSSGRGGRLERLSIAYSGDTSVTGIAIDIPDQAMSTCVKEVYVTAPHTGVRIGNCQGSSIENFDCWYFVSYGIHINDNFNDCFFDKIFLNGAVYNSSTVGANNKGIYTQGKSHAMFFSNVEVIQCNQPLSINGSSATNILTAAFSFFVNCFFDSSSSAASVAAARNIKFIGCWFSNRDAGISISNSIGISFQSCQFVNNNSHGAIIQAGCSYIRFLECIFDSNSQSSSGSFSGIAVNATAWLDVSHCTFGNLGTFSATQGSGIVLLAAVSSYVNITDNAFSTTLLGTALVNNSTGANIIIRDNQGYITKNLGNSTLASGATTLPIAHGMSVTPSIEDIILFFTSGRSGVTDYRVSDVTSTTFTITVSPAPTTAVNIGWQIDSTR